MPPKKTTPVGELTAPELRKLIKAHNILSKITIPKGTDRNGLIKLIEGNNYKIDHKNKVIKPQVKRGPQITLKKAEELTKPKPVSEEVKKARAEKKKEKEEEKKKEIKIAKKEAVQEFKTKQKEAQKKKPAPKPKVMKKEDEVRPKEKVGRPKIDPKKINVIEPKKEEKYNEFLKLFNEAKERRNRKPFQELRDRIFRYSEPFLYGTKLKPKSDGETLKAQKDPEFLKIKSLLDKVDNELEKYYKIGGLKYPKPKPLIISNKPALNTKKIEPKKEAKKEEPKPRRKLKGRLTGVRDKETARIEKEIPEFYAPDKERDNKSNKIKQDIILSYRKIKSSGDKELIKQARELLEQSKSRVRVEKDITFNQDLLSILKNINQLEKKPKKEVKKEEPKKEVKKEEPKKEVKKEEPKKVDRLTQLNNEVKKEVLPIFYDWLKNKDKQLYSEVKKFSKWKVPPVVDEETMAVIKKGVKNPRPKYYKEKEKMIKEAKKKFTELHKKYNYATPHREFTKI